MFSGKSKLVKIFTTVLFVITVMCFTLAFTACASPNKDENNDKTTPTISATANVAFSGDVSDEDIADGLTVKIVGADGTESEIEFTVKSKTVSDDGTKITIVIEAGGIEKTIVADYVSVPERVISDELLPLYEVLSAEGDKSFTLYFSAVKTVDGETETFSARADLNILEEEGVEFDIVNTNDEDEQTVVAYKDLVLFLNGKIIDLNPIIAMIADYLPQPAAEEDTTVIADGEDLPFITDEEFSLEEAFLSISDVFKTLNSMAGSSMFSSLGISIEKENGIYTIEIDSKILVQMLPAFLDGMVNANREEDDKIDFDGIFEIIDKLFDGALSDGDYTVTVSLGLDGTDTTVSLSFANNVTEDVYTATAILSVNDELADIVIPEPEVTADDPEAEPADLGLDCYFDVCENTYVELNAILHTSNFEDITDKDILTVNLFLSLMGMEADSPVIFVLNDKYVYLDITGLYSLLPAEEPANTGDGQIGDEPDETEPEQVAFYYAFEIDGEPASFTDVLPELIDKLVSGGFDFNDDEEEYEIIDDDENYPVIEDGDDDYPYYEGDDDYPYYEDEDEENFTFADIVKYLRFVEIEDAEKIDYVELISASIDAIKAICADEDNAEILHGFITVNEDEGGIISIAISSEENIDLIDVINLFVGIPTEEGFADIDATAIKELILKLADDMPEEMIDDMLTSFIGVDLDTFLSDLYVRFAIFCSEEEGFYFDLCIGGTEKDYLYAGFGIWANEPTDNFELTEDMIEGAYDFEDLKYKLQEFVMKFMGGFMGGPEEAELIR